MEEFIEIKKVKEEVNLMSPLTWAYVGDAVYELYIRTKLVNETNLKPHKLHIESIKYVKAGAQAKLLEKIYENLTNEDREEVYSKAVKAGKRTYFFDVKATRNNDYYLTITESKKKFDKDGVSSYEKHKIFLYKEDFEKFAEGLEDAVAVVKSALEGKLPETN